MKYNINKSSVYRAEERLITDLRYKCLRFSQKQLSKMNKKKKGRPFIYCKDLVLLASVLLYTRNLSYRRLVAEVFLITGIRISKSQLHERIMNLKLEIHIGNFLKDKIIDVAVDATGFRPTEKGLWRMIVHEEGKIKQRNGYIKLLAICDVKSKYIISAFIGSAHTADITLFQPSLEDLKGFIIRNLYGDGSFDAFSVYRECGNLGITPVVKPDKNSVVYYNKNGFPRELRSSYVKIINESGYEYWRDKYSYGERWAIEGVFSKWKRVFGEVMRSKKDENIVQEFIIKIWIYNMLVANQHRYSIFYLLVINYRTAHEVHIERL